MRMEIQEKVAYLRGLTEGLSLDPQAKETKLLAAVTDILDAVAKEIKRLDDSDDALHNMLEDLTDGGWVAQLARGCNDVLPLAFGWLDSGVAEEVHCDGCFDGRGRII